MDVELTKEWNHIFPGEICEKITRITSSFDSFMACFFPIYHISCLLPIFCFVPEMILIGRSGKDIGLLPHVSTGGFC